MEGTLITMSIMAAAFLLPIKVQKPHFLGKIVLSILGVCGFVLTGWRQYLMAYESKLICFLYNYAAGRFCLKILTTPWISRQAGKVLD